MKSFLYGLTPFLSWFVCGILKFLINCLRERRFAFDLVGYGGLPSNHSAIVSSMTMLVGLREGFESPIFGVSLTLAFIVILDANGLRRAIGNHAILINHLADGRFGKLRERMGHSKAEITAGVLVGCLVAFFINVISL